MKVILQKDVKNVGKKGDIVIEPQYDVVYNFSEGLALVLDNHKWGYIDKKGKMW